MDAASKVFRLIEPITSLDDITIDRTEANNTTLKLQYYNGAGSRVDATALGIYIDENDTTAMSQATVSLKYFESNKFEVSEGVNGTMIDGLSNRYGVELADQTTAREETGGMELWTPKLVLDSPQLEVEGKKLIMLLLFTQSTKHKRDEVSSDTPSQQKRVLVLTKDSFDASDEYVFSDSHWWDGGSDDLVINSMTGN